MLHLLRKVFTQPPGIPNYRVGPNYDGAGAGAFVFEREFQDPLYNVFGPGKVAGSFMVLPQPQVYYYGYQKLAGLGGQQAGQFALQPLGDGSNEG